METAAMKSGLRFEQPHQLLAHLRLPALPEVALRVIQLTNNENVQLHQLSEVISSDAAFASEVLTIANSAAYALRFPACSIVQAVAVLGANHLQGICLTVAVRSYLGKSLGNPLIRNLWRHNLACAAIAEQLAAAGFMDKDTAYTAGILHDIGRLALAVIRPAEYAALLRRHKGSGASILKEETDLFGTDHCQAGRHLVGQCRLPAEFDPIVFEHHCDRRAENPWSMGELIKISCRMADAVGFPAFPGCEIAPFADLQNELPDRERGAFHWEADALAAYVVKRIKALDPA
jgi:putative nucleotidyltransferase with HDIG domain